METTIQLPKGITTNKLRPGKFVAQYWNKDLKKYFYIGQADTIEEAVAMRNEHIAKVYSGDIDDSVPKTKGLPKGICETERKTMLNRYIASLQFLHGKNKDKHVNVHIGMYDTIEEAVQARLDFIESLK